jgi:hypothetical protein
VQAQSVSFTVCAAVMSIIHDESQYGAFKGLLEDSRAPDIDINEYKMNVLDIIQSGAGMSSSLAQLLSLTCY